MSLEEEQDLKELQRLAKAHYEQRIKKIHEQANATNERKQGNISAPQSEQAKNTIGKKRTIRLRKYLLGGEARQNENMFITINSFIEFESGKIIKVGCLPWVVVGEMPLHDLDRVEVTA